MKSGFAIVDGVFDLTEVRGVVVLVDSERLTRSRAGARHLLGIPAVFDLASDQRLVALAADSLGGSPAPFRATLFDKSAEANWLVAWHQDTAVPLRQRVERDGWGPWSVKAGILYAHAPASALQQIVALRVHLDDSTSANGPLRVLPGTHSRGVLADDEMVAMRPLLVHASSKSRDPQPRRVLHIEYASEISLAPGIELAAA